MIEEVAQQYLEAKAAEKAAKKAKEDARKVLIKNLALGSIIVLDGVPYVWNRSTSPNVKYKEAITSVYHDADPQHQVLIEAALHEAQGSKTTYSLSPSIQS